MNKLKWWFKYVGIVETILLLAILISIIHIVQYKNWTEVLLRMLIWGFMLIAFLNKAYLREIETAMGGHEQMKGIIRLFRTIKITMFEIQPREIHVGTITQDLDGKSLLDYADGIAQKYKDTKGEASFLVNMNGKPMDMEGADSVYLKSGDIVKISVLERKNGNIR
jgi:hypothetical protein